MARMGMIAARQDKSKVYHQDFEAARDKVLMGRERKSMVMGQRELETTAAPERAELVDGDLLQVHVDRHLLDVR